MRSKISIYLGIILTLALLSACGKSTIKPVAKSSSSSFLSNALTSVSEENQGAEALDQETFISQLIKALENLVTRLENDELPAPVEGKEQFIAAVKAEIEKLKSNQDYQNEVYQNYLEMFAKMKEAMESGELPIPRLEPPVSDQDFTKEI